MHRDMVAPGSGSRRLVGRSSFRLVGHHEIHTHPLHSPLLLFCLCCCSLTAHGSDLLDLTLSKESGDKDDVLNTSSNNAGLILLVNTSANCTCVSIHSNVVISLLASKFPIRCTSMSNLFSVHCL